MCSSSSVSYEFYTIRVNTLFEKCKRTGLGSFLNVTDCLVRDVASVISQTGSAPLMHRTKSGSDVIQGDRCPFTMQSNDNLRTWSNIMMIPDATPLHVSYMFNLCQIRTSNYP